MWRKTTNAPEKNHSSPRRLAIDTIVPIPCQNVLGLEPKTPSGSQWL